MSNDDVYDVIVRYITEICEDVDPGQVARDRSMKDLGANSLDIVEVVSCSMRELGVRIPRSELGDIRTIGGLADRLEAAWAAKHA
ncbi:MAG: acyl carrier protein [Alphaproteobacteria bacterium]|nr:acyl carrier protein [Alphaproteobacteria bacterium]